MPFFSPTPQVLMWPGGGSWHGFSMLLTGDAEAESAPIDPGPVDVLKLAHHGSEDAGIGTVYFLGCEELLLELELPPEELEPPE